jgi:hypothetical protein
MAKMPKFTQKVIKLKFFLRSFLAHGNVLSYQKMELVEMNQTLTQNAGSLKTRL